MKLLNRPQIESLAKFKSRDFLTTSFYLDTNKSRMTKKEVKLSLKNLVSSGKTRLSQMSLDKAKKESLFKDLEIIYRFCSHELPAYNFAGIGVFSCSSQDFWQVFNLCNSPRNRIIFDQNPYVRPLSAILDEHHRICVLTLDRKEAKWYDIFMGDITLIKSIIGDVPSKVKEGGWEGYESKRIERHISGRLRKHLKTAAKVTFELFKETSFDRFFIGCQDEYYTELESLFHSYCKDRLKGRLRIKPADPPDKILKEALELKNELKVQEKKDLVLSFVSELEKGRLTISGLKNTLRKLNNGEAQILLITRNFSKPGKICPKCGFLFVDETHCLSCQSETEPLVDVIDEAIELAMDKRCSVKHINPPSKLSRYGNIGAFLRYKT